MVFAYCYMIDKIICSDYCKIIKVHNIYRTKNVYKYHSMHINMIWKGLFVEFYVEIGVMDTENI